MLRRCLYATAVFCGVVVLWRRLVAAGRARDPPPRSLQPAARSEESLPQPAARSGESWLPSAGAGPPANFKADPAIPGFFHCHTFASKAEQADLLSMFRKLGAGAPDRKETGARNVFAGLQFPESEPGVRRRLEAALVRLVARVPLFDRVRAVGVVLLRYDGDASLPPHTDDPEKYGGVVVTAGFGSPAVLQLQEYDQASRQRTRVERVLLEPGAAYAMSGPSRREWLHGIEPGATAGNAVRGTRFALLLTEPMPGFGGAALLRHAALRGGGRLFPLERRKLDLGDASPPRTAAQALDALDRAQARGQSDLLGPPVAAR
jgi:hypothetical protein